MSGLLLIALVMANVPVYLLVGRLLFGTWEKFLEAVRLWASMEALHGPMGDEQGHVSADARLGVFLACSAGTVLIEFLILANMVLGAHL